MPCFATGSEEGDLRLSMSESAATNEKTVKKLTAATRVACELAELLTSSIGARALAKMVSVDTTVWIKKHRTQDDKKKPSKTAKRRK